MPFRYNGIGSIKAIYMAVLFCFIFLITSWPGKAAACTLTIGIVPQLDERQVLINWRPILAALEETTNCRLTLITSPNIKKFEDQIASGLFDLAYVNPYQALLAHDGEGYLPLVRSNKKLQGVLVVPQDSPLQSVKELQDQQVAFPTPHAFGASLLMQAELHDSYGIKVTPLYVHTHDSVYLHVTKGLVPAGSGINTTLIAQPEEVFFNLRTLYETREVNASPLMVHPRVQETHRQALQEAFIALGQTHRELLLAISMDEPVTAKIQDYHTLRGMEHPSH